MISSHKTNKQRRNNLKAVNMMYGILLLFTLLGLVTGDAYLDGKDSGYDEALAMWTDYETSCATAADPRECVCSFAWDFEDDCQEMMDDYEYIGGGPYKRAFERGFKAGVGQVVDDVLEDCLDDPDICEGLGQVAASIIVDIYCGAKGHMWYEAGYEESCTESAIDFCEGGAIKELIDSIGGCSIDSNQALNVLKDDCEPVVECLLGIETDDAVCDCVLDGDCPSKATDDPKKKSKGTETPASETKDKKTPKAKGSTNTTETAAKAEKEPKNQDM